MLEEAWYWLQITSTPSAQTLGYRRESAALRARHRRCAAAWRPHIEATRSALLASAHRARRPGAKPGSRGRGLLLGGGLPLDIPWRVLLDVFDEVILADVCFHAEARAAHQESRGRVRLMSLDVTGILDELTSRPERIPAMSDAWDLPPGEPYDAVRWVASVNLLSQLPLLPCAWLRRHGHGESALEDFARALQRRHLARLSACTGSLCLVAETADHLDDADGHLLESVPHPPLAHLQHSKAGWTPLGNWQWQVNPPGELHAGMTERRDITALHRASLDE